MEGDRERQDVVEGINISPVQLGPTTEGGRAGLGKQRKIRLMFGWNLPATG